MTTKTNTNGQVRKSLADQIDRLDAMLDGLSEGLNDAVAQAVKDAVGAAVKEAVQAVLREMLSKPELLARLSGSALPVAAPAPAAPEVPKVSWKQRWAATCQGLTARLAAAREACGRRLASIRQECSRRLNHAHCWCVASLQQIRVLGQYKYQLLTALGVGLAAGAAVYFAGPWLAAAAGGLGAFTATLAVQAGVVLKRMLTQIADPLG